MMTKQEVEGRILKIVQNRESWDYAHILEDELRRDVLKAIAEGAPNAQELAVTVLRTADIEFPRSY